VFPGYAILEEQPCPSAGGDDSALMGFDSWGRRRGLIVTALSPHLLVATARRRSICVYRGRRKSIVEHTIFFPTISAWAMEHILCYCEFRGRYLRDPEPSELPFDFSRSLELLMAANYLEIDNLVSYLAKLVADNFPRLSGAVPGRVSFAMIHQPTKQWKNCLHTSLMKLCFMLRSKTLSKRN